MEPHPSSSVDTSRPFRSVKEAVAVFGERILASNNSTSYTTVSSAPKPIYAISPPKPMRSVTSSSRSFSSFSNQEREDETVIINSIKKLEVELEETKRELALLKERESEREIAVASLNAELHKNLSSLAASETPREAKRRLTSIEERWREEETKFEYLPCLAEALRIGDMEENYGGGRRKSKMRKKKPIVPLIGDMFSRKKPPNEFDNSLYSRPFYRTI